MADQITLTLPADRDFDNVAHLVLGGLAARLDLTFDHLEDLQIALDGLFAARPEDGDLTVTVCVRDDAIEAQVGPFDHEAIEHELAPADAEGVGLRRILDTVVDGVEVEERDGEGWVQLVKRVGAGGAG